MKILDLSTTQNQNKLEVGGLSLVRFARLLQGRWWNELLVSVL